MTYVHGYSDGEASRLADQANTLADLLHYDTHYPEGSRVLEAGCGTGAQTLLLAGRSPGAAIVSVDLSPGSVKAARERILREGHSNADFVTADIFSLPFQKESFDHVFACFVLEHLKEPVSALKKIQDLLRPGGSLTVIEGDHGSVFFHPESDAARKNIRCLIDLQAGAGGDPMIGRKLFPLLCSAGYHDVRVSPRMVYVDSSRPALVEGFTQRTFTAMVAGVGPEAVSSGKVTAEEWEEGILGLNRTTEEDGIFCYTFFRAACVRP